MIGTATERGVGITARGPTWNDRARPPHRDSGQSVAGKKGGDDKSRVPPVRETADDDKMASWR